MDSGVRAQTQRFVMALSLHVSHQISSYSSGEAFHDGDELANLDGLRDVGVVARCNRADAVLCAGVGGQRNGGNVLALMALLLAYLFDQVVAVSVGHADIADEQIEWFTLEQRDCFGG